MGDLNSYWQSLLKVGTVSRPIKYGPGGHYGTTARLALVATQAAGSRLFTLRNANTANLVVLTSLYIQWLQTGAHTAAIEDSLDVFRVTGFSAIDTTNYTALTVTPQRSAGMGTAGALVGQVTAAGAAAGTTGGTLTVDAQAWFQLPQWLLAAQPTGQVVSPIILNYILGNGEHPLVLKPNEGLAISNRVLLGASASSSVYIDVEWAEVDEYLVA